MHVFLLALFACEGSSGPAVDAVESDQASESETESETETEPVGTPLTFVIDGSLQGNAVGVAWYGRNRVGLGEVLGTAKAVAGRATVRVPPVTNDDLEEIPGEAFTLGRGPSCGCSSMRTTTAPTTSARW